MKVLGTGLDLAALKSLYGIDKIVVAFNGPDKKKLRQIRQQTLKADIDEVLLKTSIFEQRGDELIVGDHFRCIEFADTIGIQRVPLRRDRISKNLAGSSVAIVGAGDRLGEQLCRELISLGVSKIIALEDCEARLERVHDIARSLSPRHISLLPCFVPLASPGLSKSNWRHMTSDG